MMINRPPAPIQTHQPQVNAARTSPGSNTSGSAALSRAILKNRITPRTDDYLQRLRVHGTPTQREIAMSACNALSNDLFIANPAREKPVSQFGVSTTLGGLKGMLLANFMPHGDKLELEALAFRAERFFETEVATIEKVVLEHAQELPEVQAAEYSGDSAVTPTPTLPKLQKPDNIADERKALKESIEKFDSQSMTRKMANKLAEQRVNDGRSNSLWTARPAAYAAVAGARVRNFALGKPDASKSQQTQASVPANASFNTALSTPRGLQYQFSKQEFADFADLYEEHRLPVDPENMPKDKDASRVYASEASRPSSSEGAVNTQDADFSPRLNRRNGQFVDGRIKTQLQQLLGQDFLSSPTARPGAQVIDGELLHQLFQHFESGQVP
ncbi:unnamed protein product, partial [Ectocarpus sp. 12 AP-2014]